MKKYLLLLACLLLSISLFSQTNPQSDLVEQGKSFFQAGAYREALALFRETLSDPRAINQRAEAYFWTAKTLFTLDRHDEAARNFEYYLSQYPDDRNLPEAEYLRARIFFLGGDYDGAALLLARFVQTHPRSPFVPNAYYWAAESFYAMGNLPEAERLFQIIIDQFPGSTRYEPARYRLDVLNLKYREDELLRLLQWTQEEALRNAQDYLRQEATYRQAIEALQEQQGSILTPAELEAQKGRIASLEEEIAAARSRADQLAAQNRDLTRALQEARATIEETQRSLNSRVVSELSESNSNLLELLELKAEALVLKEAILNSLLEVLQ